MKKNLILSLIFLFFISSPAFCQDISWEPLVRVQLKQKAKKVEIGLPQEKGQWNTLRFGVENGAVRIIKITGYSAMGLESQVHPDAYIRPGEFTSPFSFFDADESLTAITLVYYAKHRANLMVYGQKN